MPIDIIQKILVGAVIIQDDKVLLQRRIDEFPEFHGKWTCPSGIVKVNEDPEDAVIREVKEECNLNIQVEKTIPVIQSFPNHKHKYHLVYITYVCKILGGKLKNQDQDGDIQEVKWINLADLDKIKTIRGTLPPIKWVLKQRTN